MFARVCEGLTRVVSLAAVAACIALVEPAHGQAPAVPQDQLKTCTDANGRPNATGEPCLPIAGLGADGYNEIDWDGPDIISRSILDFPCYDIDVEIEKFRLTTRGIASSVPSRPVLYAPALARIQALFGGPRARRVLDDLRADAAQPAGALVVEKVGIFAAVQGNLPHLLAATLARHEAAPRDPTILFSLASLLVQSGMPNEAIALLDRITSSGSKPDMVFGYRPDAALDYLRGYSLLMTGKLAEAQTLLARAFATDPTLTDASYTLAIAEAAQGRDPRKHVLQGMSRTYSGSLMYCGEEYDKDPLTARVDQNAGPEADELFDLHLGTPGVLPSLVHPSGGPRLLRLISEMTAEMPRVMEDTLSYNQRATEIFTNQLSPRLQRPLLSLQDLEDQALFDMLNEANAQLKPLQRMRIERNKLLESIGEVVERDLKLQETKLVTLSETSDREAAKALARDIVSASLNRRRVTLNAYDTAVRRHYRAWHRYVTGIAGYITDPTWRQYADLSIKAWGAATWGSLYTTVVEGYSGGLPLSEDLYAPEPALPKAPGPPDDELWRCSPSAQRGAVEAKVVSLPESELPPRMKGLPGFGLTMKANCDEVALEGDGKFALGVPGVVDLAAGGFVEGSVTRSGDVTIYGGPKGTATVSALGASVGGTVRDGLYLTLDSQGAKELGFKIDGGLSAGAGPGELTLKMFEEKFVIWSAPPRPAKFDRATGLTVWQNVR
jgi:tetratricopeptide (TPR) repeat protein